jgi:hypothetical protein
MRFVAVMRRALVGMLLALCCTASADAQTPGATLPSKCLDQQVAPLSVILTCADAGFVAHDLVWSDWGAAQARATGTATVKTCDPDCASGGTEDYAVELVADQLHDCEHGQPQYTLVSYRFPGASPFPPGSPGADDPTVGFPCPKRRHADPRIKSMKMRSTGHHAGGDDYFVRVHITLRVCAIRGRSKAVLNETKRIGGQTFGEHTRTIRFRQRSACQSHKFSWKLRDEFFGIGTYRVAATVWDADSQFSRTVSRRSVTTD